MIKFRYKETILKEDISNISSWDQLKKNLESSLNLWKVTIRSIQGELSKNEIQSLEDLKNQLKDNKSRFIINSESTSALNINSQNKYSTEQGNQFLHQLSNKKIQNGMQCQNCPRWIGPYDFQFSQKNQIMCSQCAKVDSFLLFPSMLCRNFQQIIKKKQLLRSCLLLIKEGILTTDDLLQLKNNCTVKSGQNSIEALKSRQIEFDESILEKCLTYHNISRNDVQNCQKIMESISKFEERYQYSEDQVAQQIKKLNIN